MKVLIIALAALLAIGIFIGIHTCVIAGFSADIDKVCISVKNLAKEDNWREVLTNLKEIERLWKKVRPWATLTISTNEIDKIEISLKQSMVYATVKAKPDFFGEFTVFHMLLDRLPNKEGIMLEEIL